MRTQPTPPKSVDLPRETIADPVALFDLRQHHCRWPVAGDGAAVLFCFKAGGLNKKDVWHGALGGKPVFGIATADLARDGMLTVTTNKRNGSARLTERGNWFARTLMCDGTAGK